MQWGIWLCEHTKYSHSFKWKIVSSNNWSHLSVAVPNQIKISSSLHSFFFLSLIINSYKKLLRARSTLLDNTCMSQNISQLYWLLSFKTNLYLISLLWFGAEHLQQILWWMFFNFAQAFFWNKRVWESIWLRGYIVKRRWLPLKLYFQNIYQSANCFRIFQTTRWNISSHLTFNFLLREPFC